jgi:Kef-type K+ transport system membrane component KefB
MDHSSFSILFALFVVFFSSLVGAEVSQRVGLPAVIGELVVGIIIGPSFLGWVHVSQPLTALSELGAVLLLFSVGLETRLASLREVGAIATLVAVSGVVIPFLTGFLFAEMSGYDFAPSMFVAATFVATSAGITARVLQDLGALNRRESRIILGAAIIDDVLGMLVLGAVTSVTMNPSHDGISLISLLLIALQAFGFIAITLWTGHKVIKSRATLLDAPLHPLSPTTLCIALCLGLACLSSTVGLAGIIGAFLAGSIASEAPQRERLHRDLAPITAFVVPFFFVVTGAMVDLHAVTSFAVLLPVLMMSALAIFSKALGCGAVVLPFGARSALFVGIGMVPRGEVGLIIASLGLGANVLTPQLYSIVVIMCLVTSLIAPPLLRWVVPRELNDGSVTPSTLP